jgi:nucleoside-diphosphate-sugar epimerase
MTGERVFVTGASGFIGRALVRELAEHGYQVRAAARSQTWQPGDPKIDRVAMPDLSQRIPPDELRELLAGCQYVVHLAGIAHATNKIPDEDYLRVNGDAVGEIADAAREAGVKRVIFVSSVRAQSGPVADGVLDETTPPKPTDAYGRSKLAGETALEKALEGSATQWVILRPVLVYGPGVKGNMERLIDLAAVRMPLPLKTLRGRRSILSVNNMAAAILHCLKSPEVPSRKFLVADIAPMDVAEIVAALRFGLKRKASLFGLPSAPLRMGAQLLGKGDAWARLDGDLVVSTEALRETGFKPVIGSNRALADLAFTENIKRGDTGFVGSLKRLLRLGA